MLRFRATIVAYDTGVILPIPHEVHNMPDKRTNNARDGSCYQRWRE